MIERHPMLIIKFVGIISKKEYNFMYENGCIIRTGKTVSGVKHSYSPYGTKILSEKWGSNTLIPLYDNKDEVCGIVFNGASYYFLKNLQGDVISISKAYNIFCRRLLPLATELCKIYL